MVMRLGAEQRAALHASARGRTETAPKKRNCDDRICDSDQSDSARETRIVSGAGLWWCLFRLMGVLTLSAGRSSPSTPRRTRSPRFASAAASAATIAAADTETSSRQAGARQKWLLLAHEGRQQHTAFAPSETSRANGAFEVRSFARKRRRVFSRAPSTRASLSACARTRTEPRQPREIDRCLTRRARSTAAVPRSATRAARGSR